ncbi:hypothetical protein CAOG_05801 [Capsaspora owczarzaki ATCC 30864]|uniref:Uncharacterized protein n=1 Tax=Capsaspora owczarzaki (strain ATCC 30864) TaxID=595528 RepID=A0A0D2UJR3_CAPO3|nr:hypothetical protein CAOG_05801 [Capsaspora owczarzaki ATCC 30864]KJE95346.1 hypothetical protein CAOG_005801 [Capsaspora owczarzaki ATCC 30864]|eukprot:XP_004345391.1 hypothetical protein CAOG_05801 [Capsaspora owczarzaki ATCC 30864]
MSFAAKSFLAVSTAATVGIIYYVHSNQQSDRERLRMGIERDLERQQRKLENRRELDRQAALTVQLEQEQQNERRTITTTTTPVSNVASKFERQGEKASSFYINQTMMRDRRNARAFLRKATPTGP